MRLFTKLNEIFMHLKASFLYFFWGKKKRSSLLPLSQRWNKGSSSQFSQNLHLTEPSKWTYWRSIKICSLRLSPLAPGGSVRDKCVSFSMHSVSHGTLNIFSPATFNIKKFSAGIPFCKLRNYISSSVTFFPTFKGRFYEVSGLNLNYIKFQHFSPLETEN